LSSTGRFRFVIAPHATADAIIYATALAHEADLLTCDRHFENPPAVRFVPKPGA
jgi:predicted nucleic acid-binding protein